MRDTQAFEIELGIEHKILGEIDFEEFVIFRFEDCQRQRIATFLDGMNEFFEFGKHGLPKKSAAEIVNLPVDDVSTHLRIRGCLKQMMCKQFFVERRGYFCQENRILVILKQLRILRKPTVH